MSETLTLVEVSSMLIGLVLPILVGLVTTRLTSSGAKAMLLAALSAVSGFLSEFIAASESGERFGWDAAALTWLMTFVVAVATHYGLWKPTGVSDKAQNSLVTPRK